MSNVIRLSRAALAGYRDAGWNITPYGYPDLGQASGPCGRCRRLTARYGLIGGAVCLDCQRGQG